MNMHVLKQIKIKQKILPSPPPAPPVGGKKDLTCQIYISITNSNQEKKKKPKNGQVRTKPSQKSLRSQAINANTYQGECC